MLHSYGSVMPDQKGDLMSNTTATIARASDMCSASGNTVAKARKPKYYTSDGWLYLCHCGQRVFCKKVGWGKDGKHGLLVAEH